MNRFRVMAAVLPLSMMLAQGAALAGPNESLSGARELPQVGARALTSIAAVVDSSGSLVRGRAHTTVILPSGTADGNYRVDFNTNIANCVFTGSLGTDGSSGVVAPGYLTVAGDALSRGGVFVETFNSSGTLTPSSFHLIVAC